MSWDKFPSPTNPDFDIKFEETVATTHIPTAELEALRAKAEAGKWATAHGFKPGDIFAGKVVQVKIHSMLFGEAGLLSIHSVAASVKGTHAGIWSKETRAFTLEQWRKFIGAHTKVPQ